MKHVVKHPSQFMNSNMAFAVGFWQFSGGLFSEILCVLFLTQQLNTSEIIVRSAAFGAIAQIDNFYANALPYENGIKGSYVEKSLDIRK
jgi:hypothetical protein